MRVRVVLSSRKSYWQTTNTHLLCLCPDRNGKGICKCTAFPWGFHHCGFYSFSGFKVWSSHAFYKFLPTCKWLYFWKKSQHQTRNPLTCSWYSEHSPHPNLWILQMANFNHCHKTEDQKRIIIIIKTIHNNFNIKYILTIILCQFSQRSTNKFL